MILYFSATGNCKYVASELSKATGEPMVPLRDLVRKDVRQLTVPEGGDLGVVMPTYWEGLPSILIDWLEDAGIVLQGPDHYRYFVATYGCDYGNILSTARKAFAAKGVSFDSCYAARFVDNWSPMFDLTDPGRNRRAEISGERETAEIVGCVVRREKGHDLPDQMTDRQAARAKEEYDRIRRTGLFELDEGRCTGCGLCARQCPCGAIAMEGGRPAWVKEECTLCLGCFHRCPRAAIDYGNGLRHGQYTNPAVKLDVRRHPVIYPFLHPRHMDQELAWDSFYRANGRAWRGNCTLPGLLPGTGPALDIGCGAGKSTRSLMDLGYSVTGMDLSDEAVSICRTRFGDEARFIKGSVLDIPFPGSSFDCAVAVHLLEHVPDADMPRAASEIGRVLRPGALLFIRDFAPGDMRESTRRNADIDYFHRDPDEIIRFFGGFNVVSARRSEEPTRFGAVRVRSEVLLRAPHP